ncbi:DMT family transporter [Bradyrhizobium sp. WD16]|uniref:DMT family transporter n=1 Tax=Bradyrhizobium sp. WD16 TaxID=1521768 RepID=UPI0020A32259|nr:DMT family transporter [Bradyrhizobium sp. WD16]UTD27209.1 EamA family transporter [Bradyrhizobium sp. WD16]
MSSPATAPAPAGRPLTLGAAAVMVVLCLSWGLNQVAIKLALPDIPPLMMATLRSTGGLLMVMLVARLRGVDIFERDDTLKAGMLAGLLFGLEFIVIYRGLLWTTATRAVVFLYVAPFVVALASFRLGERLGPMQWGGLALSFAGVALAIGVPQTDVDATVMIGDLMVVAGGVLWAATTIVVKLSPLLSAPAEKTLAYQLAVSIPILGLGSLAFGERITGWPGVVASMSLVYQTFWVVGLTFLFWFMLVRSFSASKLSAFTFMTPLFGVTAGHFVLHDPLSPAFVAAAVLVIAGLMLVNRPVRVPVDPLLTVTKT